jgi:hypothetical protein
MVYERKQQMHEKLLKQPPRWILGTINRELNLFKLCGNEMVDDFAPSARYGPGVLEKELSVISS